MKIPSRKKIIEFILNILTAFSLLLLLILFFKIFDGSFLNLSFLLTFLSINIFVHLIQEKIQENLDLKNLDKVFFKDVCGLEEAKEELRDIVNYFKNKEFYQKNDISLGKGIIFYGPPGNGKTLLAKALSNEIDVPFLFINGTELISPFHGVSSSKVKNIFSEARKQEKGSIVFIDEADSFTKKRGTPNFNDDALSSMLSELDGLKKNESVFVILTTNRIESMDQAFLREGRFDLKINISNPGYTSRKDLFLLKTKGKKVSKNFDVSYFAKITNGFSGAKISSIIKNSFVLSARKGKSEIDIESIDEAFDFSIMGPILKLNPEHFKDSEKITAFHEVGHLLVGLFSEGIHSLKVTIAPHSRVNGYFLFTTSDYKDERSSVKKNQIISRIKVSLAGKIIEEEFFGREKVSLGCTSDLESIENSLDNLLLLDYTSLISVKQKNQFLFGKSYSENSLKIIEDKKSKIISDCEKEVKKIIVENKEIINIFVEIILSKKTIYRDDIIYIFFTKQSPFIKLLK